MSYKILYKCRLCGETFGSMHTEEKMVTSIMTELHMSEYVGSKTTGGFVVTRLETRYCDGHENVKRIGMADLIGAERTE